MAPGKIYAVANKGKQKKVLSNKALTRRLRAIDSTKGTRLYFPFQLDDGTTAPSSGYNAYRVENPSSTVNNDQWYHSLSFRYLFTQGNVPMRMLVIEDMTPGSSGTPSASDIFDENNSANELLVSAYANASNSPGVATLYEANHKNRTKDYRYIVRYDSLINPLPDTTTTITKVGTINIPLKGKKVRPYQGEIAPQYYFIFVNQVGGGSSEFHLSGQFIFTEVN